MISALACGIIYTQSSKGYIKKRKQKKFSKTFAKPLDKSIKKWYNISTVKKPQYIRRNKMSEYKKTKYEATIKLIARLMTEGQYKTAQRFINRLMKHYDDMTEVEKEVVEDQRLYAFSKPARNRVKKNERQDTYNGIN